MSKLQKASTLTTLLSLLIAALSLYTLYFAGSKEVIDSSQLINITSAITTGLAFLVGCFFALLAVSAYSHFRDIEKINKHVNSLAAESEESLCSFRTESEHATKESKKALKDMVLMIDEIIGTELYISSNHLSTQSKLRQNLERRRVSLLRKRAFLALKYKYFPTDRRVNLIRELFELGHVKDLPVLEAAAKHNKETPEVKEIIEAVIVKFRQ